MKEILIYCLKILYDSQSEMFSSRHFNVVREFSINNLHLDTTVPKKRLASEAVI